MVHNNMLPSLIIHAIYISIGMVRRQVSEYNINNEVSWVEDFFGYIYWFCAMDTTQY